MKLLIFIIVILLINLNETANLCSSDDEDWAFDCSNRGVKWSNLVDFNDNERASIDLNLASNDFYAEPNGFIIKNYSFNLFKQISGRLNLSSNKFSIIESHAFYYIYPITNDISSIKFTDADLNILSIKELDLSNNSFKVIPWNSLKNLSDLTTLRLSLNPIKRLDLGDLANLSENSFENLKHVYLNSSNIEYIDPNIFDLIKKLKTLDLSNNKIKSIDNFNSMKLENFYIFNNPLECNCKLLWLKKFLNKRPIESSYYKNRQHSCYVNIRPLAESFLVESKTIFINSSSLMVKQDDINEAFNIINSKEVPISDIDDHKFYCDIKLDSQIENLSLPGQSFKRIKLECTVETYPEPEIKWLLGQKDLDRDLKVNQNYLTVEKRSLNGITYKITSSLVITLAGPINQDTFSCRAFYKPELKHNRQQVAKPIYSQKSVSFNLLSDYIKDRSLGNQTFTVLNSTVSAYLSSIQSSRLGDQPFIYYIIFGILFLFCFLVILFVGVCIVRHKRALKKEEHEYGYSGSDYSSINKRSTIYTGSNSLRGDSSTIVPLKPDVIREHQDYSSIYGQFFRTPSKHSNYLNTLMISPESLNQNYDNDSVYTNNNSIPIYLNSRQMHQSFDNNPIDHLEESRSSSYLSSKTFEENTEEYLEPKFDDLRKPQKQIPKQSMI